MVQVAFGEDVGRTKTDILINEKLSFKKLAEKFSTHLIVENKVKTPYFVRGEIDPDNPYRLNKNLLTADLLIIDGDKSLDDDNQAPPALSIHKIAKHLKLNHIIYTSYSHTSSRNKWRLILPCFMEDKACLKPTVAKLLSELNAEGANIKPVRENNTWAQAWFMPSCPVEDSPTEFYSYHTGKVYQPVEAFQPPLKQTITEVPVEKSAPFSDMTLEEMWAGILINDGSISHHQYLCKLSQTLANKKMEESMVYDFCLMKLNQSPAKNTNPEEWQKHVDALPMTVSSAMLKALDGNEPEEEVIIDKSNIQLTTHSGERLSDDVLMPKGYFISELTLAFYESARFKCLILARMMAHLLVAYLGGGKYKSDDDDRLNMQFIIIGQTSLGKQMLVEGFQSAMAFIFPDPDEEYEASAGITSNTNLTVQGLEDTLFDRWDRPDFVFLIPEIGVWLSDGKSNDQKRGVFDSYTTGFDESNMKVRRRALSQGGKNKQKKSQEGVLSGGESKIGNDWLYAPHRSMGASTTIDTMIGPLSGKWTRDGSGNRYMTFGGDAYYSDENEDRKPFAVSEELGKILRDVYDHSMTGAVPGAPYFRVSEPVLCKVDPAVKKASRDLNNKNRRAVRDGKEPYAEMKVRESMNSKTLAMGMGILEEPESPVLDELMWENCKTVIESGNDFIINLLMHEVGENELQLARKKILAVLNKAKPGEWLKRAIVVKPVDTMDPHKLNALLKDMEDNEMIEHTDTNKGKPCRPGNIYRISLAARKG